MSANLLADLDSFYQSDPKKEQAPVQQTQYNFNTNSHNSSTGPNNGKPQNLIADLQSWPTNNEPLENDDDDFGEFESGQQDVVPSAKSEPQQPERASRQVDLVDWNIGSQSFQSQQYHSPELPRSTQDDRSSWNFDEPSTQPSSKFNSTGLAIRKAPVPKKPRDENVLFDAEDEDDEDGDFGDFEDAESSKPPKTQQSLDVRLMPIERRADEIKPPATRKVESSLLDFDNDEPIDFASPVLSVNTPRDQSSHVWDEPRSGSDMYTNSKEGAPDRATPQQAPMSTFEQPDDAWDDFETGPTLPSSNSDAAGEKTQSSIALDLPTILPSGSGINSSTSQQPPSNIPPPAVLLSLITPILATAKSQLFDPLAALSSSSQQATRSAVLSHPSTETFLRSFVAIITVAGRIVAGRKLRWKRDNLLSQSMRIGPSMGGRSGGMKLTGVDKSESAREDREVADIVRAYRAQVGRLRTAVTGAGLVNELGSSKLTIPELAETMPVRTATGAEGGITAPKSCALCGIKRNERVGKVDGEISDAFGEWWIEFWGHRGCRNFWEGKKDDLAQR